MTDSSIGSTKVRVPREDGSLLARPTLREALDATKVVEFPDVPFGSMSLQELRRRARWEVIAAAVEETGELLGESVPPPTFGAIVATGHQPEPFHPGVLVKNVAADALARRLQGVGLNIAVDNDVHTTSAIRIPAGNRESARFETIAFDAPQPAGPWEEAEVVDPEFWSTFPDRLREAVAPWGFEPGIRSHWLDADRSLARSVNRIRARRERAAGLTNLEVSLSSVCRTPTFHSFALHLLREADRFREIHEAVLDEHRRVNRIRSRTHPVPSLEIRDKWMETPFWTWRAGERTRRPVFVRQRSDWLRLSDGHEDFAVLPADDAAAIEELHALEERGIRLRTRALTTTMFLRLCVADLFIHGVGGAKYDELTDYIIGRFVGVPAPPFVLLSATLHLPLGGPHPGVDEERQRLQRDLRDLRYNPDRHLPPSDAAEFAALIAEKQRLVRDQNARRPAATRRERRAESATNRARYDRLRALNAQLVEPTRPLRSVLASEVATVQRRSASNGVLGNREWAWWLYPNDSLLPRLQRAVESQFP